MATLNQYACWNDPGPLCGNCEQRFGPRGAAGALGKLEPCHLMQRVQQWESKAARAASEVTSLEAKNHALRGDLAGSEARHARIQAFKLSQGLGNPPPS